MPIYGTALLAACLLAGVSIGKLIGALLGVDADIGGVGVAMLLLIFSSDWLQRRGLMSPPSESGIVFWGQIYVPIVVAMAASQNVRGALGGGVMAFLAGAVTVAICFALVKVLSCAGRNQEVSR
jgi:malonate transporter MadL subunit